jgi:acetoin utilization deacetylase AcuC-like enzyme
VPLPPGADDARHLRVLDEEILPSVRAYRPQLVFISAGFDAHSDDPLGMQRVTEDGFAAMTQRIMQLADECCNGRVVVLLEGGYNQDALARSVAATLRVLDQA